MSYCKPWRFVCLLVLFSVVMAGCQRSPAPSAMQTDDPHLLMQNELEKASLDFSKVVTVRLQLDGQRVEVTSVMPAIIAATTLSGQTAKTIFRLNAGGDGLILFSRDLLNGKSNRIELSLAELQAHKSLTFPVVQPDGNLKEKVFTLEAILRPSL